MGILTNLILMQWTLEKYSKYADGVAERSTKMKEGFSKIKEELPTEPAETTFIDAKQNSESDMARQDVDPEAQEEVEDEAEIEGSVEAEAEIEIAIDVAAKAVCVEVGTMEGHKSHANTINTNAENDCIMTKECAPAAEYAATTMLRDQPKDPMKCVSIHGPTEAEITVEYTWKHFFQEGFATEASHWSRPLFFTLSKTQAVAESSSGNWILVRVSKAHWGRSPKFIWKYNSCGPGGDETMAHLITNSAASSTQRTETWCDAETKTISLDPLFATSAVSVGQLVQVEDEEATADCSSVSETYGVLCLVLGENGIEFSGMAPALYNFWKPPLYRCMSQVRILEMEESIHWYKRGDIELASDIKMHMTRLTELSNFTGAEGANWTVLLGYSVFAQLCSIIARILKLLCLLRYLHGVGYLLVTIVEIDIKFFIDNKEIDMSRICPDTRDRAIKDDMPRTSSLSSIVSLMSVPGLTEWVGQVRVSKKGLMLSGFLEAELTNRKGLNLLLLVPLTRPVNLLVWIVLGSQDFVSAAMAIEKGAFTVTIFFDADWIQIRIIHYGWKISFYCSASDVLAFFKAFQNQLAPPRHLIAGFLILLCLSRVPRTTVAEMPPTASCSRNCWLRVSSCLLVKIEEMLISTTPDLVGIWIMSCDVEKQKLTSISTNHLEDKVALHGGGIVGIGLRPSDKG